MICLHEPRLKNDSSSSILEAVWCHWCHVMDQTTYASAQVADLINAHYIPVRVDQDANPD